jgi:outer membrane protein assembly factor BamB
VKKAALAMLLFCLGGGVLYAGLSLGRPAAVKKRVSRLDDKVLAAGQSAPAANRAPAITGVVVLSSTVATGNTVTLTVSASDPDGDTLSYVWVSTAGTIGGSGASITWVAPSTVGVYAVTCSVSDGNGHSVPRASLVSVVDPGTPKWVFATGAPITAVPAIGSDGTVYVASTDGELYALNPGDGTQKWSFSTTGNSPINSSPAIGSDGTLYFGDDSGLVYAVSSSGLIKSGWPVDIGTSVQSSPAIGQDGTVYVGSDDFNLYALDPAGGTPKWTFTASDSVSAAPVVGADGTVYAASDDYNLYAVNPVDGTPKAGFTTFATGGALASPALGADGAIYVGSNDGNFYAVKAADGSAKWGTPFSAGGVVGNTAVIGLDGTLYIGGPTGNLNAIDPANGTQKAGWPVAIGSQMRTAAVGSDGTIYVGADDSSVYAVDPADGSFKWTFAAGAVPNSPLTLGPDGTLYFGGDDNNLYAVAAGSPLASTSWPAFRKNISNTGR